MIEIHQRLNVIKPTQIEFQSETTGKWISNDLPHKESSGDSLPTSLNSSVEN